MEKKGAAHLEMIISFIFFTGFVLFLFLTLRPYDTGTLPDVVVTSLRDSYENRVHTNLTTVFLKADSSEVLSPCFKISLPEKIFSHALTESIVTTLDGSEIESFLDSGGPDLNIGGVGSDLFYYVKISPEFEDASLEGCDVLPTYDFGSFFERKVLSNSSIVHMKSQYYSDYGSLKGWMGVPDILDFSIVSSDLPEYDMVPPVLKDGDVLAREYLFEVLYGNGTVINALFTFEVW